MQCAPVPPAVVPVVGIYRGEGGDTADRTGYTPTYTHIDPLFPQWNGLLESNDGKPPGP